MNVPSEGSATCTLTNTYTPPTTGVRVWKDVIARDRETDVEDDATFTVTLTFVGEGEYSTSSTFSESSPALFAPLEPGAYYVSEEGGDSYETFEIPETVTVTEGEVEEITVTNRQLGTSGVVVIEKNVVDENGNDISDGTFFTVVVGGETSVSIAEGSPDTRELGLGSHSISENPQDGYELVSIVPSVIEPSLEGTTTIVVTNRRLAAPDEDDGRRHSASGRRRGRVLGASTDGAVLGSSTDSCEMYLAEYIWKNRPNNPAQVSKLQEFLNKVQNAGLTVNGEYDAATQEAVGVYQIANWATVLAPWFGNAEPHVPTYNVYKTTRWLINETECAGSEAYPVL